MGISQYDPAAAGRPAWNAGRQVGAQARGGGLLRQDAGDCPDRRARLSVTSWWRKAWRGLGRAGGSHGARLVVLVATLAATLAVPRRWARRWIGRGDLDVELLANPLPEFQDIGVGRHLGFLDRWGDVPVVVFDR